MLDDLIHLLVQGERHSLCGKLDKGYKSRNPKKHTFRISHYVEDVTCPICKIRGGDNILGVLLWRRLDGGNDYPEAKMPLHLLASELESVRRAEERQKDREVRGIVHPSQYIGIMEGYSDISGSILKEAEEQDQILKSAVDCTEEEEYLRMFRREPTPFFKSIEWSLEFLHLIPTGGDIKRSS